MKALLLDLLIGRGPWVPLLGLVVAGGLVFLLASRLAQHADAIAETTGLGRLWIGSVLLAAATSLPEVLTAVDAALLHVPDIGVGDLLGATLVNVVTLALLDLIFPRRRVLASVAPGHARLGVLGLLLAATAGLAIVNGGLGRIGHVGIETLTIGLVYAGVMGAVYRSLDAPPGTGGRAGDPRTGRQRFMGFVLTAGGLVLTAPFLVLSAEAFSRESGVTQTFVGTFLVGVATTIPEMAVTASAIRLGALDLAVGNIFGSNAFNMTILLLMDLVYVPGPVLTAVSESHLLTIFVSMICLGLAVMAIVARDARRPVRPRVESPLIVIVYAAAVWILYRWGA